MLESDRKLRTSYVRQVFRCQMSSWLRSSLLTTKALTVAWAYQLYYTLAAFETVEGSDLTEVNPNMRITRGYAILRVYHDMIMFIELQSRPIYSELPPPRITNLEKRLAASVTTLISDGATIQVGYGAISESITPFLTEKKDLGLHSEMFPESAMALVDRGVSNGCPKRV